MPAPDEQQIPPLRFAPVGMTTKKKVASRMTTKKKVASWDDKQKDSFLATTNKKETERSAEGGHGGVYAGANAGGPP